MSDKKNKIKKNHEFLIDGLPVIPVQFNVAGVLKETAQLHLFYKEEKTAQIGKQGVFDIEYAEFKDGFWKIEAKSK